MKENPAKAVNDAARKVTLRGKQVIVPLKFDEDGNPAAIGRLIFKRLSIGDLRFLQILRESEWNAEKAIQKAGIVPQRAKALLKKLACFRDEEAKIKALCEIPTPDWIAAKHVENVYNPTLEDSQHKSLVELAKIEGAYKHEAPANQLNVFNINLTPEQEAKLKPVFDTIAMESSDVAA